MKNLIAGYHRFHNEVREAKSELLSRLASGQSPETLFITCSDSRVVPALLTQSEPGDLFVIRNAGNLVPPYGAIAGGEQATIEYAVAVLGVKNVVVCGHSDCGAMKGLLAPESLKELPDVAQWLQLARPALLAAHAEEAPPDQRLNKAIEFNALQQLQNLRTHPAVARAVAQGALTLHAWVFDIGSGAVRNCDHGSQRFVDLASA